MKGLCKHPVSQQAICKLQHHCKACVTMVSVIPQQGSNQLLLLILSRIYLSQQQDPILYHFRRSCMKIFQRNRKRIQHLLKTLRFLAIHLLPVITPSSFCSLSAIKLFCLNDGNYFKSCYEKTGLVTCLDRKTTGYNLPLLSIRWQQSALF